MFIGNATKDNGFVSCSWSVVSCGTGGGDLRSSGRRGRRPAPNKLLLVAGRGEETFGRGDGGDPVLGGTRLVFFFFLGDVSSFSAQVERGPFGSLPTSLITCALSAAF